MIHLFNFVTPPPLCVCVCVIYELLTRVIGKNNESTINHTRIITNCGLMIE